MTISELDDQLSYEHPNYIRALAGISKKLANIDDTWGLVEWPSVNPRNIRDKIFIILEQANKPLHFSEIAKSIQKSEFKKRNVTTQAIHNELIKDPRFILVGRGIYAIESWGFSRGTVADIISNVLQKADHPLHRDEIIKEVLKNRQVKEATVILNLQSRPQFKRVAKATYTFDNQESS
jgi:predicted Zn-ribbon and HTH transcriptional regulator